MTASITLVGLALFRQEEMAWAKTLHRRSYPHIWLKAR
jgi:hypothetical protein